jgi:hypothetical protein
MSAPRLLNGLFAGAAAALLAALLAACGNQPPVPDWQMNAKGAMDTALEAYLSGNARVAEAEFKRARAELARTGRPELMARAELMRCAAQVASLDFAPCTGFAGWQAEAAPAERAYAAYLQARVVGADVALLPEAQRGVAAHLAQAPAGQQAEFPAAGLAGQADPLARLVGAAVLLQAGRASPAVLGLAIDTASAQGWRRPLLAWLELGARRAELAGQAAEAAQLRRRAALVTSRP